MIRKLAYLFSGLLVVALVLRVFVFDPAWERAKDGHKLSRSEKFLIQCWVRSSLFVYGFGFLAIFFAIIFAVMAMIRASVR
jgi:hypothetical protein